MSIPAYFWYEVQANNQTGDAVITIPQTGLHIPSPFVRAHAFLLNINHSDAQNSFAADCYISSYVQNGNPVDGNFKLVAGANITNMKFTVSVNGCEARAGFLIELFW